MHSVRSVRKPSQDGKITNHLADVHRASACRLDVTESSSRLRGPVWSRVPEIGADIDMAFFLLCLSCVCSTRQVSMTESRGFVGRRGTLDAPLPPGQYLTTDFPVLPAGPTPHVRLE
jgi:hypothetical protein